MKESSEDICYDKELGKLDCPDCEQVLYSKGTSNMLKTEERRKGSFGFWFSFGAALLNLYGAERGKLWHIICEFCLFYLVLPR